MTDKALPTADEFERELERFINETLLGGGSRVNRDTRLFEDGYMNSLRVLDLIAFVEKTLGRRIPDRAVRLGNFGSIATIVRAFHPAAAPTAPAVTATGGLFEHRLDRSRFASPVAELEARGDLRPSGAGQVALGGLALDVLRAVDHTVADWARSLGALERRFPSLIPLAVLDRAGQVESFPQHLTVAGPYGGDLGGQRPRSEAPARRARSEGEADAQGDDRAWGYALAPAVCYHAYPEWEGRTLGAEPVVLTARGRCYRYEGPRHASLERLWDFTMREIIALGSREQVEAFRQSLVRRAADLVTALELDAAIEAATDPFFTTADAGRRLMQQAGALKYELLLTVGSDGHAVAASSFNHHHDFFGARFGIRLAGGEAAHSGCVAFGLERWVLGVLAQHGTDERQWPAAARAWIARSRAADAGSGGSSTDGAGV